MAFETRLTPPPSACTCRWMTGQTVGIGGDGAEVTIPEYRRLSTSQGCPIDDPPKPWPQQRCTGRGCSAAIVWALTWQDKKMPVDAVPDPDGNVLLEYDIAHNVRATVLTKASMRRAFGRTLYVSHFATCPDAAAFRTGGKR